MRIPRLLMIGAFFGSSLVSLAQGTLAFATLSSGRVDAPVFLSSRTYPYGAGIIPGMKVQLFLVRGEAFYEPLYPTTTFFGDSVSMTATRYVIPSAQPVVVPGTWAGQEVTIVMRAWHGPSYEASSFRGQSAQFVVTLGGRSGDSTAPSTPPAALSGLQGFTIVTLAPHVWFTSIEREENQVVLRLAPMMQPHERYIIEGSDDLKSWSAVLTNSAETYKIWAPLNATAHGEFFRVRVPVR